MIDTDLRVRRPESSGVVKIINGIAILVALAGFGIGIYALAGPLGVWLGMWNFGRGFQILQQVNTYADNIAQVGLLATAGAFVAARLFHMGNSVRVASLVLAATIAAAAAYFIPESFRPPEGTPPIHDITTNTANPPEFVAIVPLRANAPNSIEYGSGEEMTPMRLTILQEDAYPDIVPQTYMQSPDEIYERALAAVDALGWELVDTDPYSRRIEATDTTFWFRFKDDVVIYIEPQGRGSVLNARSVSRVGVSDVGKNAERLRDLFDEIQ